MRAGTQPRFKLLRRRAVPIGLVVLAFLAYLPTVTQPLLEDDYPNIAQAMVWGPPSGWAELAANPIFRVRTTSYLLMYLLHRWFGMHAPAYYLAGIALHAINTLLVYAIGSRLLRGSRAAAWGAAFFAAYEGSQEAIMWFSACNELLFLSFGLGCLYAWTRFLDRGARAWLWYAACLLGFFFALISLEAAPVILPLMVLVSAFSGRAALLRAARWVWPCALLAAVSVVSILFTRSYSFRFHDGSFSWKAPFVSTWAHSMWALLWVWGLLSLIALAVWKVRDSRRGLALGLPWMAVALTPYIFLTYMSRIPSRQTYLASVGLSWLVGSALDATGRRLGSRRPAALLLCAMLASDLGILWVRKRAQFSKRAEPTEQLISMARRVRGPIYMQCFPRTGLIAEEAVHLMAGHSPSDLIWDPHDPRVAAGIPVFCYREQPKP